MFSTMLFPCLFFTLHAFAAPLSLIERDVYDPPITSPSASTVWVPGETTNVTWDTSMLPSNLTNVGMLVLGFMANNSENLDIDNPLAQNFLLTDGTAQIIVPSVVSRDDYIVVLFGDSGNASPEFTITSNTSSSTLASTFSSTSLTPESTTISVNDVTTVSTVVQDSSTTGLDSTPVFITETSIVFISSSASAGEPTTSLSPTSTAASSASAVADQSNTSSNGAFKAGTVYSFGSIVVGALLLM